MAYLPFRYVYEWAPLSSVDYVDLMPEPAPVHSNANLHSTPDENHSIVDNNKKTNAGLRIISLWLTAVHLCVCLSEVSSGSRWSTYTTVHCLQAAFRHSTYRLIADSRKRINIEAFRLRHKTDPVSVSVNVPPNRNGSFGMLAVYFTRDADSTKHKLCWRCAPLSSAAMLHISCTMCRSS